MVPAENPSMRLAFHLTRDPSLDLEPREWLAGRIERLLLLRLGAHFDVIIDVSLLILSAMLLLCEVGVIQLDSNELPAEVVDGILMLGVFALAVDPRHTL